jgi:hypothetical protein
MKTYKRLLTTVAALALLLGVSVAPSGIQLPLASATTAGLYDKGREAFLLGAINMSTDTIKAALVDGGTYTPNLATDQYWSSVSSAVVCTPATLGSKTTTAGVFDAADVTYTSCTGNSAEYVVIYKDTGTGSTSPLIAITDVATGIPVTPNGGNITITWDNGSNKIFKL